jgi:hypothetical protein
MVFSYNSGVHGRFSCCCKTHLITGGAPLLIVVPGCGSSIGKLSRKVEGSSIRFLDRFSGKVLVVFTSEKCNCETKKIMRVHFIWLFL